MPTASAVVADMIDTAAGRTDITFRRLELWSDRESKIELLPYEHSKGRYYMRFHVADEPGVLSQITGILGKHQVSIASIIQHEPERTAGSSPDESRDTQEGSVLTVPLVIMTHQATESAAMAANTEIRKLASVRDEAVYLRVSEGDKA